MAQPGLFLQNVDWDGSTPFQAAIKYNGKNGLFRVRSIGMEGHPDYLFEATVDGKTLLASSQERALKDYNLTWKSDATPEGVISIACRHLGVEQFEP
jgi:hypothetical protein